MQMVGVYDVVITAVSSLTNCVIKINNISTSTYNYMTISSNGSTVTTSHATGGDIFLGTLGTSLIINATFSYNATEK